jgi:hypothetical protein
MKMTLYKVHMLRCVASVVAAPYKKIRLTPPALRTLHLNLFPKPPKINRFSGSEGFYT